MKNILMDDVIALPKNAKMAGRLLLKAPGDVVGGILSGIVLSFATNILSSVVTRSASLIFVAPSVALLATACFCYLFFLTRSKVEEAFAAFMTDRTPVERKRKKLEELCLDENYGVRMVGHYRYCLFALGLSLVLSIVCYVRAGGKQGVGMKSTLCECPYCRLAAGKGANANICMPLGVTGKSNGVIAPVSVEAKPEAQTGARPDGGVTNGADITVSVGTNAPQAKPNP
jgi:hypothetical protein